MAKPQDTLAAWLEWAEARAARVDDCLVWKQAFNGSAPQACLGDRDEKETVNVRRKLWSLRAGRPARRGYVVVCKCETYGCIEPEHLKEMSRSQLLRGKPLAPTHRIALTKAARSRSNNKLTADDVHDIRHGEGSVEEKAARYGIGVKYVEDIIRQRCWRDLSNPFAGLGAR